jgi:hypothetical protein
MPVMHDIDKIPAPTNLDAANEFNHLRSLVQRHQQAHDPRPEAHAELAREIDSQIEDAEAAETALTSFPQPESPADLEVHNRALLKARESRVAYELLRKLLGIGCGASCAFLN